MRNLQYISLDGSDMGRMTGAGAVIKRSEISRAKMDDVRLFLAVLRTGGQIQDYDRETDVLKETSNIIRNSVRSSDLVIRFGDEEFLVVLLDIKGGETTTIAEKIRTSVESAKLKVPDGVIKKTISLASASSPPIPTVSGRLSSTPMSPCTRQRTPAGTKPSGLPGICGKRSSSEDRAGC